MKMKWHYRCPLCDQRRCVDWGKRNKSYICKEYEKSYIPPSPADQNDAYVDTHTWPEEIETVTVDLKGTNCSVPDCKKKYETLDHRIPFAEGGNTSVDNLFPMCTKHNQSKGDTKYDIWLLTIDDDES